MTAQACRIVNDGRGIKCETHNQYTAPIAFTSICDLGLAALRATLDAIAQWTPVSARACPMCVYQEGKFLAPCAWHRETEDQARVIARLREALQEISEGKGRFSRDQFEHCRNTVEDMKALAIEALSPTEPPSTPRPHYVCRCEKCLAASYTTEAPHAT